MVTSDQIQSSILCTCLSSDWLTFYHPFSASNLVPALSDPALFTSEPSCAHPLSSPNSALSVGPGDHSSAQTGGTGSCLQPLCFLSRVPLFLCTSRVFLADWDLPAASILGQRSCHRERFKTGDRQITSGCSIESLQCCSYRIKPFSLLQGLQSISACPSLYWNILFCPMVGEVLIGFI